jgi:rRNA maturation endonuclease Nob1
MCAQCGSRFAAGVKFCGRCGGRVFLPVTDAQASQGGSHGSGSRSVVAHGALGVKCLRCGTDYPPGTKFCGRCGIPIQSAPTVHVPTRPQQVVCHNCHTSYQAGTKFCGRCGIVIRT